MSSLTDTSRNAPQNTVVDRKIENQPYNSGATSQNTSTSEITTDTRRCPEIELVRDLKELHQFSGHNNYDHNDKIATVTLVEIDGQCQYRGNEMALRIDMTFDAVLGPKSRIFDQDQPTISYPYFIAITDSTGEIVDKELHGVSLRFSSDENSKTHIEDFKKIVNLNNLSGTPPYIIMVGFQLSPEELHYNQVYRARLLGPEIGRKPDFKQSAFEGPKKTHL